MNLFLFWAPISKSHFTAIPKMQKKGQENLIGFYSPHPSLVWAAVFAIYVVRKVSGLHSPNAQIEIKRQFSDFFANFFCFLHLQETPRKIQISQCFTAWWNFSKPKISFNHSRTFKVHCYFFVKNSCPLNVPPPQRGCSRAFAGGGTGCSMRSFSPSENLFPFQKFSWRGGLHTLCLVQANFECGCQGLSPARWFALCCRVAQWWTSTAT